MAQAADDDAERARNRARLYAPPRGVAPHTPAAKMGAMGRSQADGLIARMAAEDSRLQAGVRAGR